MLLLAISLLSGLVILTTSIATFKNDKIAYIFETNNSLITSIAEQFKTEIKQAVNATKILVSNMSPDGSFSRFPIKTLQPEEIIDSLEVYKVTDNSLKLFTKLSKENIPDVSTNASLLLQLRLKKRILSFQNENVLVGEIINTGTEEIGLIFSFKSDAMISFFENNKSNLSFLIAANGNIIQADKSLDKKYAQSNFLKFFQDPNLLGSVTLKIKTDDKKNWLMTSVAVGYDNYYLVSLVDEENAMSALRSLTSKSILIFSTIFFMIIIIGIIASRYLTSRLSLLSDAARKVSNGDYKNIIEQRGNDEITELTANFNQMTSQIVLLLNEASHKARMESELKTARAVQETLFPKAETKYLDAHIKGKYVSATECGGDWWYYSEDSDNTYVWIADATGHGASAALLTSAAKSAVTIIESMHLKPSAAMAALNKAICSVSKENMMMTCFMAQINKKTKLLTYVNASHEAPIIMNECDTLVKKDLIFLNEAASPCLGQSVFSEYTEVTLQLKKGHRLLVFTDGVPDIRNNAGEALGERGFLKILIAAYNSKKNFSDFTDEFADLLNHFRQSSELVDDVAFCFTEVT